MPTITNTPWLIGAGIVSVTGAVCTVASDGTVTPGSNVSIRAYLDTNGISRVNTKRMEDIHPMVNGDANHVPLGNDWEIKLTEIVRQGVGGCLLESWAAAGNYIDVIINDSVGTFTLIGAIGELSREYAEGKNIATLSVKQSSVAPTYVPAT